MNLEVLNKNENQKVHNLIIIGIRDLINFKSLEPGDKLPSERMLSEKFEVSRSNVREAIQKLEFYGLLKSRPQSGTFVANIGVTALNGMIEDILRLDEPDFKSLVETRILLELNKRNIQSLIIEGGSKTLQKFIIKRLWDEANVYIGKNEFKNGIKAP